MPRSTRITSELSSKVNFILPSSSGSLPVLSSAPQHAVELQTTRSHRRTDLLSPRHPKMGRAVDPAGEPIPALDLDSLARELLFEERYVDSEQTAERSDNSRRTVGAQKPRAPHAPFTASIDVG